MNPRLAILPVPRLRAFCRKWHIRELAFFGSALRDDFRNDSDVDFLVSFHSGRAPEWPAIMDMEEELAQVVGRRVDIVERPLLEKGANYIKRHHILTTAESVYVEG